MSSVVEICNRALSNIRGRSINSLTESSIEAQQCVLHYNHSRQTILRDISPQFAKKTVPLALLTDEPLQWTYAYQYPSDCLKIRMITGDWAFKATSDLATRARYQDDILVPEMAVPYDIELSGSSRIIATDLPDAYCVYTKDVTDPTLFDATFEEALTWLLSARIAIPVAGGDFGRQARNDAMGMYQLAVSTAVAADQNERKRQPGRLPGMVEVRK